jgi:hypothetical protein
MAKVVTLKDHLPYMAKRVSHVPDVAPQFEESPLPTDLPIFASVASGKKRQISPVFG